LLYVLEYGIGVKIDSVEQFRLIYKGKAHKCIITDLMPKTTFRLRVQPILRQENREPEFGEWSEIINIQTREAMHLDLQQNLLATSKAGRVLFDKPGILCASYGYSFGEHLWLHQFKVAPGSEQASLIVGVLLKRFSNTNKLHGV
jgi:hypothetical protein